MAAVFLALALGVNLGVLIGIGIAAYAVGPSALTAIYNTVENWLS